MLKAIHVVYANWCPHCVPTTVGPVQRAAKELGVPCVLYDIETEDVGRADDLVREHGDWTPDYVIPQVFFETDDGRMEHVLTGDRRGIRYTREELEAVLKGALATQHASRTR